MEDSEPVVTSPGTTPAGAGPDAGRNGVSYAALTFALFGGAILWLLRLIANAALVSTACDVGSTWPLWLTSAIATLVTGMALVVSWRYSRWGGADAVRWLGVLGIMFNVLAVAGIVLETLPVAVLDVCPAAGG